MKYNILKFNNIAVKGLNKLPAECYRVVEQCSEPDAILLRSHRLQADAIAPSVLAIVRAGAGVNNIPVADCTERGIPVFNTPGANANAVNELIMAALCLASRHILPGINYVKTLAAIDDATVMNDRLEKEKKRFKGHELVGKTLGIIGLGAIGSMVAETALSLGMKVAGYDPALSVEAAWQLPRRVKKVDNLPALVGQCDFVTLHLPVLETTRHLINKTLLQSFKPGSCLLNFAREAIVDSDAVADALLEGHLTQYISDFPTPRLINLENTILTPHMGASTHEAEENCAVMAIDQLKDFLDNGNIRNSVNFPALSLERNGGFRLAISNRNVPKILGSVLSLLADENLNVIDMINKSRQEIAYNLIDVDVRPSSALMQKIHALDGVVSLRLIEPL